MQRVMPYCVNGGKHPKMHLLFFLSVFRCLIFEKITHYISEIAEYEDILVQIIYAKFKNDTAKDNGYTKCTKMLKNFCQRRISAVCISLLCSNCYHLLSVILAVTY